MKMEFRTLSLKADGNEYVLSDDTVDSYGDIIDPKGWVLSNFKKNPIALFGHSSSFPIGTWSDVRVEGGKLIGRLTLAARGTSNRLDELIQLVEQKILRAVSVGFIPIKSEPLDPERPHGPQRYLRQELRECSLVSVPANPAAIQMARSMNVSEETLTLAFGGKAEVKREAGTATGAHAHITKSDKGTKTMTLAERIEAAQKALNEKRDRLAELAGADDIDGDAMDELTAQIDAEEKKIATLQAAEKKIGVGAKPAGAALAAPGVARRPLGSSQKEVRGVDLIVRAITARGIAHFGGQGKTLDQVLSERYPGNENVAIVAKADQTIGTTTVSGWASELVQSAWGDFMQALQAYSIYPALRDKGIGLSFDGVGTVNIPGRTAGGAGGGFVGEGQPIRVGRITTASVSLTPRKMGVIVPFSRELAKRSTPTIEALVRQAILEDTAAILDAALVDATAGDTVRPAGLLNGVSAVANGYGGGDAAAVTADFAALLGPFFTANASDSITVLMNPLQAFRLSIMPGPDGTFGWSKALTDRLNIVESTRVPSGRLIALRTADFVTALGDAPEFDISEQATLHMEDTTPLELVAANATVADPQRSLWQTATIGVRMLMDVAWKMRRTGMVQWVDTVTW